MLQLGVITIISLSLLSHCGGEATSLLSHQTTAKTANHSLTSDDKETQRVRNKIKDIVAKVLDMPAADVDTGLPLAKQKVPADDLDVVDVVLINEESFVIEIPDAELGENVADVSQTITINKLADIVLRKLALKPKKEQTQ